MYAFASTAHGWRRQSAEKRTLELATACAVLGTFKILGMDVAPRYLHSIFDFLYRVGYAGFVGILILGLSVYLKNRHDFSLTKAAFFWTLVLFFSPIFLAHSMEAAFFSYAMAHGIQYLVFMTVLSFNVGATHGRRGVSSSMMALSASILLIGFVGYRAAALKEVELVKSNLIFAKSLDFAAGTGLGATIAHFVIDAGAWRLSLPSARNYVAKRFGFLFKAPRQNHAGLVS